jgi:hypothetical protein
LNLKEEGQKKHFEKEKMNGEYGTKVSPKKHMCELCCCEL